MALRVFLDTEFLGPPTAPVLLSIGLVTDRAELYMELPSDELAALPRRLVDDFIRKHVLAQFGRVDDARVSRSAMPDRLVGWLNALGTAGLEVVYDFSADYWFIESLTAEARIRPSSRLEPCHVGYLLEDADGCREAEEVWLQLEQGRGVKRHHALADAFALRARFRSVHGAE